MSSKSSPEPLNQNRDARLYMLGMWVLSLVIGGFLPYLGLSGWLAVLMELLVLSASAITAGLVVFTFRRYWDRPTFFIAGVGLAALAFALLNAVSSAGDSLPMQSIASVVALIAANLLWMAFLVGLNLVWMGQGGWSLLIAGSIVALWTPWLAARFGSVDTFIDGLLGLGAQGNPINTLFCGALCAVPIALLALLSRLLRGLAREMSDANPPARPR